MKAREENREREVSVGERGQSVNDQNKQVRVVITFCPALTTIQHQLVPPPPPTPTSSGDTRANTAMPG